MKHVSLLLILACSFALSLAQSNPYYFDFGPNDALNGNSTASPDVNGLHWNNITNPAAGSPAVPLINSANQAGTAYLQVLTSFQANGILTGGLLAPSAELLGDFAIATATQDYFFTAGSASLEIGGLTPGDSFICTFFATRDIATTRISTYTLTGSNVFTGSLTTSGTDIGTGGYDGNNQVSLVSTPVYADAAGKITLSLSISAGVFAYINCMKLEAVPPADPELSRSFLVDLGPNDAVNGNATASPDSRGKYWNNLASAAVGTSIALTDTDNQASGVSLQVSAPTVATGTNGILNGGLLSPNPALLGDLGVPSATQDFFFTTDSFSLSLSGLNPYRSYVFHLFGSRNDPETRRTAFLLTGTDQYQDTLQTSGTSLGGSSYNGNTSTVLTTSPVQPNAQGIIVLKVKRVEGIFAYLNDMRIDELDRNPQYFVDFGPNDVTNGNSTASPDANGHYWNNLNNPAVNAVTLTLTDKHNVPGSITLRVQQGTFQTNGILNGGLLAPSAALLGEFAIATATQDYFFVSGAGTGTLELSGLDPLKAYVFSLFGTRNTTDTRITRYVIAGSGSSSSQLQTSGTALGGAGYNGNNSTVLETDAIYPDADGRITLRVEIASGGFGYLNFMKVEEVDPPQTCASQDPLLVAVMGSSVAFGVGSAGNSQGYAYQHEQLLNQRFLNGEGADWDLTNISVGGNNTVAVLARWESDLLPLCGSYVMYGLSLGNEGIIGQGQAAFDQFRDNMLLLIERARGQGIEPVVVNCYANNGFGAAEYNFTKQMNLLIHEWDVASINSLGAVDDGTGKWAAGYFSDALHPNQAGHNEMSYTIVPSLFDALAAGKPRPQLPAPSFLTIDKAVSNDQLDFTPEGTLHPFTCSFGIRTAGTGTIAGFTTDNAGSGRLIISSATGAVEYESSESAGIGGTAAVNDGNWHTITLTHYYARSLTLLYVDGVLQGQIAEQLEADVFSLSAADGPTADYRNWYLHRSGMTAEEIAALSGSSLLQASLELYAPLGAAGFDPLANLAQSTGTVQTTVNQPFPVEWRSFTAEAEGSAALLNWTVARETQHAGFGVQMQAPGEPGFTEIGFVESQGTAVQPRSYVYRVPRLGAGLHHFRLRQQDQNGGGSLSETVSVQIAGQGLHAQIDPNPASGTAMLRLTAGQAGPVHAVLSDLAGRQIRILHWDGLRPGPQELPLGLDTEAPGMYLLRISNGAQSQILRLTIAD